MAGNENKNAPNVEQTAPSNTSEASEVPPIAGNENENALNPDQTTPSNNGNATKEPYDPVKELAEIPYEFGEYGGVHKPIEVSATFTVSKPEDISRMFKGELGPDRHFLYSRHYNPTVMNLSRQMAKIENTEDAYCVSSGMAAISCVLIQICQSGGHVVAAKCLYGGTHALLTHFLPKACGITTTFVDVNIMKNVKDVIKEETKVIFVESISNPTLTVANIPELAKVAHERRLKLVVDNTFAPMVLTPARHGADVVVHSLSKYVCGGADSIAVNIPNSYNTVPLLTGSNYNTWKESIEIVLGCMKLDIALREPEPPKPSSKSKEEEKAHYKAWTESNIMCLKIMKYAISEAMKGAMPNTDKAKDFLTEIGKRFTKSEKAELCSLLSKLIRATYNGKGNIREFIIEQIQVVSKIRNLGLKFDDDQLVYLIMISLPPQYSTFQVNFNTIKDKWTLDELISQCVQEEERLAKQGIVHNVNFVTPGQGRKWKNKKRKQNSKKGSSDPTGGNQPQSKGKAKKKRRGPDDGCFFWKKPGHQKRDCEGFKA